MAKQPLPGHTKTRLCPPLSPADAAALYECFLRDVLDTVRLTRHVTPFIAFAPPQAVGFFRQLAPDFDLIPQEGDTLNERLASALRQAGERGYEQVVAINSDSPTLPAAYLTQAFAELEKPEADVVFGPCEDGGYYLIGWKRPIPRLVLDVTMSTPRVLHDTLVVAQEERVRVTLLPTWYDVDDAAGLERLETEAVLGDYTRAFLAGAR